MRWGAYRADQRLMTLWADQSGEWLDSMRKITDPAGLFVQLETDVKEGFF